MKRQICCSMVLAAIVLASMAAGFWASRAIAATFVLVDANACLPNPGDPATIPWAHDPNLIDGVLLPADRDPNGEPLWRVPAGKYNRTGTACDPEGDPIDVELVAGTVAATVEVDPNGGLWHLRAELPPGEHAFTVRAVDRPKYGSPATRYHTVLVEAVAPPNTGANLH
jgi:hypothetical protein